MKKFAVTFIGIFLLMTSLVAGATIDFYKREALITRGGTEITDTILFGEVPQELRIPLLFSIHDFSSSSTFRNYECEAEKREYGSLVGCKFPQGAEGRLTLEFKTEGLTRKIDSHYYYEDTLKMPATAKKLVYTTKLESGLVLIPPNTSSPFPQYSPKSGEKGSDGRRIFVYWTRKNVSKDEGITPSLSFEIYRKKQRNMADVYTFVAGVAILIVLLALAFRSGPRKERDLALKKDESQVMDIIEDAGGEIKQKRIVNNTDFSKAKVSRLIKDLEERGLLEKEKVGRTNRVKLKEKE